MLTIQFDRQNKHATFGSLRCRGEDAYFDICRSLTDRGWWDEVVQFVDERGMVCLTTTSLHACARFYRPVTEADHALNKSLAALRAHRGKKNV